MTSNLKMVTQGNESVVSVFRRYLRLFSYLPVISTFAHYNNFVRRILAKIPIIRSIYDGGINQIHPFDIIHGTDTSGASPNGASITEDTLANQAVGYSGSQPSIIRRAFATIPELESCTFLDFGCGKGRPLLVATEFPFKDIVGVELSPDLAKIAQENAKKIANLYPNRTPARVVMADASTFPIPTGDIVLFLYNPFGEQLIRKVVERIEEAVSNELRRIFIVYLVPIYGECFDASPLLNRRFAKMLRYAPEELGYGWFFEDLLIIWQGGNVTPEKIKSEGKIIVRDHFCYLQN